MAVTRVELPYLMRIGPYWYFRHKGQLTRMPGKPGEAPFLAAYERARGMMTAPPVDGVRPGSLAALVDAYRASPEWRQLRPATRKDYDKFLPTFRERAGEKPVRRIDRAWVMKLRARYADETSNRTANKALAVLSVLLSWSIDRGWRDDNPALRPKRLKVTGTGYRAWTADELERFLAAAPPHLRLACLLGTGTAQRAADLCRMTWAAYRDGEIEVTQAKTGARVTIPVFGPLADALAGEGRQAGTILVSLKGRPYTPGNLSHDVRDVVVAAGLPDGLVTHGWRATGMTLLAEAGCSTEQIKAISGHRTGQMIEGYTRAANQKVMARGAVVQLRKGGK